MRRVLLVLTVVVCAVAAQGQWANPNAPDSEPPKVVEKRGAEVIAADFWPLFWTSVTPQNGTKFLMVSLQIPQDEDLADDVHTVWIREDYVPRGVHGEDRITHYINKVDLNCSNLQSRVLMTNAYNGTKTVFSEVTPDEKKVWKEAVPSSVSKQALEVLCSFMKQP